MLRFMTRRVGVSGALFILWCSSTVVSAGARAGDAVDANDPAPRMSMRANANGTLSLLPPTPREVKPAPAPAAASPSRGANAGAEATEPARTESGAKNPITSSAANTVAPPAAPERDADRRAASATTRTSTDQGINPSTAAREQRGLGLPNGPLSARPRPTTADPEAAPTTASRVAALDPRTNGMTRTVLALALVLLLILAVRFMVRRSGGALAGGGRPAGVLEVLARYPVARGQSLLVIKMARRLLLVHHGSSGMHTLSEISDPDEVASVLGRMEAGSRKRDAPRFQSALRAFEREHEERAELPSANARSRDVIEVVDLTRRPLRRVGRPSSGRRLTA